MAVLDTQRPKRERQPLSVAQNTAAQASAALTQYAYGFISAPIVLAALGLKAFGLWAVTGGLAQYGALLDLGVSKSLSRFIAANERDRAVCGEYVGLALAMVTALLFLLLALAVVSAGIVSRGLGGAPTGEIRLLLCCSATLVWCSLMGAVITGYSVGMRRMVTPAAALALSSTINFAASVTALALGANLAGYAAANAGAGIVGLGAITAIVISREGAIPLGVPRRRRIREFLPYATRIQLAWTMDVVNYQTDKIVVGFAVGPAAAGAYELGNRIAAAARQFGLYPSAALLPALAARYSEGGLDQLRSSFATVCRTVIRWSFPPLFLCAACAPLLLAAWLPRAPREASIVLLVLTLTYVGAVSADPTKVAASAAGDPRAVARVAIGTAIANLALTALLAPFLGLWGVLLGTAVALTVGAGVQVLVVSRSLRLAWSDWARPAAGTAAVSAGVALPVAALAYSHVVRGRPYEFVLCGLLVAMYALVYLAVMHFRGEAPAFVGRLIAYIRSRTALQAKTAT